MRKIHLAVLLSLALAGCQKAPPPSSSVDDAPLAKIKEALAQGHYDEALSLSKEAAPQSAGPARNEVLYLQAYTQMVGRGDLGGARGPLKPLVESLPTGNLSLEGLARALGVKNVDVIGYYWGSYQQRKPELLRDSFARLLRWFFNAEISEVYAEIGVGLLHDGLDIDDAGLLSFTLSNGIYGTLDTSWSRPSAFPTWGDVTIEVVAERGWARLDWFKDLRLRRGLARL